MQVRFLQGLRNTGLAQLVVALVSKTRGRRFESFNPCKLLMELWCRWLFARWTENPEALVRLKVAPQICNYNSFMNCYFKFIICSYSTTVSASVFQTEDASSILVSCSIYLIMQWCNWRCTLPYQVKGLHEFDFRPLL